MSRLRIAVLEDDPVILDHLVSSLKALDNVLVVTAQEDATKYMERVRATAPDALMLDIEIHGDKEAGLDIAQKLELPVIFISGQISNNLLRIEKIQRLKEQVPVEHLTKGFDEHDFRHAMYRFIRLIDATRKPTMVDLRLQNRERLQVRLEDIVSIESPDGEAYGHNDRIVYFTERRPVIVPKLSMTDAALEADGFPKGAMLRVSKFSLVNPQRITRWSRASVWVECKPDKGSPGPRMMEVGAAYADAVEARLKEKI